MEISGLDRLQNDLIKLRDGLEGALSQAMRTSGEIGADAMQVYIASQGYGRGGGSKVINYNSFKDWMANAQSPLVASGYLVDYLGLHTLGDLEFLVGWEDAFDYVEAQDVGWSSGGAPADAWRDSMAGAGFVEVGYQAVDEALKAAIPAELRALGIGTVT